MNDDTALPSICPGFCASSVFSPLAMLTRYRSWKRGSRSLIPTRIDSGCRSLTAARRAATFGLGVRFFARSGVATATLNTFQFSSPPSSFTYSTCLES